MSTGDRCVLLLDTHAAFSLPVMRALSARPSLRVHILSLRKWSELRVSCCHATYEVVSPDAGEEEYLRTVIDSVHRNKVDVILPVYEDAIRFVSAHRTELERHCRCALVPSVELMDQCRDKWEMALLFAHHGIPAPETVLLTNESLRERSSLPPFPVLLKPIRGQGGRKIVRANSYDELVRACERGVVEAGGFVVQRFVTGCDVGVNVLCRDGEILAYTIQRGFLPHPVPFAPEVGVNFVHDERLLNTTRAIVRSIRWNGVAHLDMWVEDGTNTPFLLEINPRFWMSLLGSFHAGVNFPYLACLAAEGVPFPPPGFAEGPFVWRTSSALSMLLKGSLFLGRHGLYPWRTVLRYSLQDPLPDLFALGDKLLHRRG